MRLYANGTVEIHNLEWNSTDRFTASCSGNMIIGSSGTRFYTMSIGPVYSPPL